MSVGGWRWVMVAAAAVSALGGAAGATPASVTQPVPPVTAAAFPIEPNGTAPTDGDGLIPNPATPDGGAPTAPTHCDGNGHNWDLHSVVGAAPADCPAAIS